MSSLTLDVSILCHLLRPCLVKRTKLFRQPSGSDEGADAIMLRGSQKRLRAGYDPIVSGLLRIAAAAGHSFSEQADDNGFCYYKGGLAVPKTLRKRGLGNPAMAVFCLSKNWCSGYTGIRNTLPSSGRDIRRVSSGYGDRVTVVTVTVSP
jgi:hypothetical protein